VGVSVFEIFTCGVEWGFLGFASSFRVCIYIHLLCWGMLGPKKWVCAVLKFLRARWNGCS